MEEPVKLDLPDAYKVSKRVQSKLDYLLNKGRTEKIIRWEGSYVLKDLFYLYLFRKYNSKCLVIHNPTDQHVHLGLRIWVGEKITKPAVDEMKWFDSVATQTAKCIKRGEPIAIIPLGIVMDDSGHANVLIYRKNGNVLEHFEPHGAQLGEVPEKTRSAIRAKLKMFGSALTQQFKKVGLPSDVSIKHANDICPVMIGLQTMENLVEDTILDDNKSETSGYCLAWCMFFTELCLRNPTHSSDVVFNSIYNMVNKANGVNGTNYPAYSMERYIQTVGIGRYLKTIIRGYSLFISEKIDKYFSLLFKDTINVKTIMSKLSDDTFMHKIDLFLRNLIYIEMQMLDNPNFKIYKYVASVIDPVDPSHQQFLDDRFFIYNNIQHLNPSPVSLTPVSLKSPSPKTQKTLPKRKPPADCPEGKIRNPATGRCITVKNKRKPASPPMTPSMMQMSPSMMPPPNQTNPVNPPNTVNQTKPDCPEGKIRNPATGRCITVKNKSNPKPPKSTTSAKSPKPPKPDCPEGKIRNPATGRCITVKNKPNK